MSTSSRRGKDKSSSRRGTNSRRDTGSRRQRSRRGTNTLDERKEEKEDKLATNIELPQPADYVTAVPAANVFPTMYETDVNDIKTTFEQFALLLKTRKEECLAYAQDRVDKYKYEDTPTDPIQIDTAGITSAIQRCGTDAGGAYYELNRKKILVTDKLSELIACEAKLEYVSGDFTKTKSVKGIKSQIDKVKLALKETEPILEEAQGAVKDITKASLDEIRALPKPNKLLVKAVKACALLIGTPEKDLNAWTDIRKLLKTSFINSLIAFEGTSVNPRIVASLERDYLGRGNDDMKEEDKLTYENVNKANAVAGNLVKWLEAQLKYNEMLPQVTRQKKELKDLQTQLGMMDGSSSDLQNAIIILEKQIPKCKKQLRSLVEKETIMEQEYKRDYEAKLSAAA